MKIFKNRYYLMKNLHYRYYTNHLINDQYFICTGHYAANNRRDIIKEFRPLFSAWFRVEDGHLPEYQPRLSQDDTLKWLRSNVSQRAFFILDTEKYYI